MNDELGSAKYVSLATYRRSGAAVATPVWCAPENDSLYVFSAADAGKVKRLRNSNRAQVAVCDVRGRLRGAWRDATAVLIDDPGEIARALGALRRKYPVGMRIADAGARLTGRYHKRAYIRVDLNT